jgi:hypothetical protein
MFCPAATTWRIGVMPRRQPARRVRRYVVPRDIVRRALGLTEKEMKLVAALERYTLRAQLAYAEALREAEGHWGIPPSPGKAIVRFFTVRELMDLGHASRAQLSRWLPQLIRLGILEAFHRRHGRLDPPYPEHRRAYVPKGARRLYRYVGPWTQSPKAAEPSIIGNYLALRALEAGGRGLLRILPTADTTRDPDRWRPEVFVADGLRRGARLDLEHDRAEQGALAKILEGAGELMRAFAERTFRRSEGLPGVAGSHLASHLTPRWGHAWDELGAPLLVLDLSFPRYGSVSGRATTFYAQLQRIEEAAARDGDQGRAYLATREPKPSGKRTP